MTLENPNIQLRSEKTRHIIGEVPPLLIRSGIGIISAIVLFLFISIILIPYPQEVILNAQIRTIEAQTITLLLDDADNDICSTISNNNKIQLEYNDISHQTTTPRASGIISNIISYNPPIIEVILDSNSADIIKTDIKTKVKIHILTYRTLLRIAFKCYS